MTTHHGVLAWMRGAGYKIICNEYQAVILVECTCTSCIGGHWFLLDVLRWRRYFATPERGVWLISVSALLISALYTDVVLPGLLALAFVYVRVAKGDRYDGWQRRGLELGALAMVLFAVAGLTANLLILVIAASLMVVMAIVFVLAHIRHKN